MEPVIEKPTQRLDLDEVRAKLSGKRGRHYWRALEEVAETPEFQTWLDDEFPNRNLLKEVDRRTILKFMGASMALAGLSGCRNILMDQRRIVPYVKAPEELVHGKPLFYATTFTHCGYAKGVLVEQHEGRPTKIEGNPDHPASLGASDSFMQASVLSLYDPDRAQTVTNFGDISTWDEFYRSIKKQLVGHGAVRVLSGAVTSPTLAAQIRAFLRVNPSVRWHQYEPTHDDAALDGAKIAFGRPVHTIYNFQPARVVVTLDAEFLISLPGSLRYSREFMEHRRVRGKDTSGMNRLYSFESMPTITGATADHRWPVRASEVETVARALATELGVGGVSGVESPVSREHLAAVARDLIANAGASVVVPGQHQPAAVHALAHLMNAALGNVGRTVTYTDPVEVEPVNHVESLRDLVAAMNQGQVGALVILGGNPVYDAPADLQFAEALQKVPAEGRVHHTTHANETSRLCAWVLPETHYLEQWGDARAFDGTLSIQQPLTEPLFGSRSQIELMAALAGNPVSGYELVRAQHQAAMAGQQFEAVWRRWLHQGVVPDTALPAVSVTPSAAGIPAGSRAGSGMEIAFQADPTIHDGRYANNGWLQELPKPMTKITWDNVAHISPRTAKDLDLNSEDRITITHRGQTVEAAAWVTPGHPDNAVTVHLGYGRTAGGTVAEGENVREGLTYRPGIARNGFNAYLFRTAAAPFFDFGVQIKRAKGFYPIASTQILHTLEGKDVLRSGTVAEFEADPAMIPEHSHNDPDKILDKSLYPDQIFSYNGPQWGMTVDLGLCTGCNACVTACQAENNIPVVGKEQVKRGRDMQWLRIDRYYEAREGRGDGNLDNPEAILFQPMMCVHCEKAPCEPVCPVAATLHSHEGLNMMVYNRCIGTRYCSNNCPYKVRRFNYLNYSDNQDQFTTYTPPSAKTPKVHGIQLLKMLNNPDVTVRGRGVMEKCTYCVQRINKVRIEAKKLGRDPADGEIVTACQQACPTRTIVFGNIADPESEVSKWRKEPRAYRVLEELQTRPRTSYLGRIRNPNPEIEA